MGRKDVNGPYLLFKNVDISTNQTSVDSNVNFLDNAGIVVSWTGTSPVGQLFVDVSNDPSNNAQNFQPTTWTPLNFGSSISITGSSGTHDINMNQLPYIWLRMRYVSSSGTGNLTATLVSKMV